jgi:NADPH:quinone reductase-like Zn-dependent oxidoreductase
MAAWLGLDARAGLEPGETVLVLGATGVAGMIGVPAAKLLGASRVVAAGRNAEALTRAGQRGADAIVRLDEAGDDLTEAIREAGGGGIDVAIDFIWGESAQPALAAMNRYGRYVQIGNAGGQEATIASAAWRRNQVGVLGHTNFAIPLPERRAVYETMAGHAAAGEIAVETETVPLDEAADAWERQKAGPRAKLVVAP